MQLIPMFIIANTATCTKSTFSWWLLICRICQMLGIRECRKDACLECWWKWVKSVGLEMRMCVKNWAMVVASREIRFEVRHPWYNTRDLPLVNSTVTYSPFVFLCLNVVYWLNPWAFYYSVRSSFLAALSNDLLHTSVIFVLSIALAPLCPQHSLPKIHCFFLCWLRNLSAVETWEIFETRWHLSFLIHIQVDWPSADYVTSYNTSKHLGILNQCIVCITSAPDLTWVWIRLRWYYSTRINFRIPRINIWTMLHWS